MATPAPKSRFINESLVSKKYATVETYIVFTVVSATNKM